LRANADGVIAVTPPQSQDLQMALLKVILADSDARHVDTKAFCEYCEHRNIGHCWDRLITDVYFDAFPRYVRVTREWQDGVWLKLDRRFPA
jgi:hypothetical protein